MALSDSLVNFLRDAMKGLGDFAPRYVTPLRAFLSMHDRPIEIQSVLDRGFTPDIANARLEEVLAEDSFLAQCCGDIWHLAHALDLLFFSRLPDSSYSGLMPPSDVRGSLFDEALEHLDRSLYQEGEFTKTAYFHLFNFHANPQDYPEAPYPGWRFVELEHRSIPQILGESSWSSFLSPPHTGRIFLAVHDCEGFNRETLNEWLEKRWKDIAPFRQVLQYSMDAIVDIDYVAPYYTPSWVNTIHREGLYYWGAPRQDKPPLNLWYSIISSGQAQEINTYWRCYQQYANKFESHGSSLRKAIRIAGNFYEDCHKKISRTEQFANLMIALEALYTPSDQSEHTFRISQSCALLIEDSLESRESTFEFLRSMFRRRGKLFHGQYDISSQTPQDFIADDDLKRLISIVRRSMLKFFALYLREAGGLDKVRKDLERAILDESFRHTFLEKADFESLLSNESRGSGQ